MVDFQIEPYSIAVLGILFITFVMLRLTIRRFRKNNEQEWRQEEAMKTAQTAVRKQQMMSSIPKSKVSAPQTRAPLSDPFGTPFAGNIRGMAAKWEAEIHQLGRQIIGQIDSKMAALQAISLDANRTANRLEILVEHLEQIARQQIEWQQNQIAQNTPNAETVFEGSATADASPTVVPATESASQAVPLNVVLKELADDLQGIHTTIKRSTTFAASKLDGLPDRATILRPTDWQTQAADSYSYSNLRGEVNMLSDYGVEPAEIARRLNISPGEVDLILQVREG